MPVNVVRTVAQERLWKKAKARAAAQGHALDYAYVMGIYQRMLGEPVEKAMMGAPQFAGWQIPGQVPRGLRDEQVELARQQAQDALRLATTPPTQAAAERASARPMLTPQAVVKDLGLDLAVGQRLSRLVDGLTTGQGDELKFRQAWMACLVDGEPGLDPVARQQLGERGLALWRSRAEQRETPMAGELRITVPRERKLEKAMLFIGPRGGRWADAAHTIPWDDKVHGKPKVVIHDKTEDEPAPKAPEAQQSLPADEQEALDEVAERAAVEATGGKVATQPPPPVPVASQPALTVPAGLTLGKVGTGMLISPSTREGGAHCMVTIRRPNGIVETVRHPHIVHMTDALLAKMRDAMAAAGKGEVLSYVNHKSEPTEADYQTECARCRTALDSRTAYKQHGWAHIGGSKVKVVDHYCDNCRGLLSQIGVGEMTDLQARSAGKSFDALNALDARARGPRLTVPAGELQKAGGPYIGPKGGKWEDPKHTRHWDPQEHQGGAAQGDLFGEKKPEPKLEVPATQPEPVGKPVDSSFWGVRQKFGVAGGPDEHYLTDAGLEVTAKVGGGVTRVAEEALRALPQDGQPMLLEEEFVGERRGRTVPMLRLTPWGAVHGELSSALSHHGLIELSKIPERRERAYRITEKGKQTLQAIEAERTRLLSRIARAHPLGSAGAQPDPPAVTVPADQPAPLPARTLDTMSDAIALGSPSGRQSQASQQAAQARLGEALFGPGGLKAPQQAQPSTVEVLRRQAKGLRDLAARGVGPRKHLKEAERLEGMAEELEAVAAGPGTEKFDRAVIRAEREFREWVGASGSGSEKRGDELAKQLQQAPVQEWPKLAHQAQAAYEQALLHWDAAAAWKGDPNHASSRVLLGLFRVRNAKGRTPPKAESTDILWHMNPVEVERLQDAAQTHMLRVRAKIDQVLSRLNATPEVDQAEDHARSAVESKHVAERMAIRDKYKGREVMKQIGGEVHTVPHPEETAQLEALEPVQAAEHREALAPGSYLRKRGENARPAELAQLAEQSASHFRRAAEWLEKQGKPSAARVRALAEKFEKLAAEHHGAGGGASKDPGAPRPRNYDTMIKWGAGYGDNPVENFVVALGAIGEKFLDADAERALGLSNSDQWVRHDAVRKVSRLSAEGVKQIAALSDEQLTAWVAKLRAVAETPVKKSLALLVPLDRLEKGAPRGGKYVKRAPRPGGQGYRYYYSEKGYERATGHVDGQRAADQHLGKRVATLLNKAGPAGLHPRRLAELVRQHGRQRVAGVLKATGCRFDKGRFYPKTRGGRC